MFLNVIRILTDLLQITYKTAENKKYFKLNLLQYVRNQIKFKLRVKTISNIHIINILCIQM